MNQIVMGGIEKILLQYLSELRDKYNISVLSRNKVTDTYFLNYFKQNNCFKKRFESSCKKYNKMEFTYT